MEIHQIVVAAAPGDAITNTALEYRRLLRCAGPSDVFAAHRDPALTKKVLPLAEYSRRSSAKTGENLLVVHLSIGDLQLSRFLAERPERLVLVYHNITPPEFFAPYDAAFARLLREGRRELARLPERVQLAIADSEYNASELRALGFPRVRVAPLVVDPAHLHAVRPDHALTSKLSALDGPVLLFVGQLLPHKRPDLLVEAYHVLVTKLVPEATLILAGYPRLAAFERVFVQLVRELNLPGAWLLGGVTPEELVAAYRGATVFVTASEHEGLCVPLLEAMAFDLPVLARAFTAIPETLGDAGLLLPADSDPLLLAEAMAELCESPALRVELVARGRRRLEAFDPDTARAEFLAALLEVA